MKILGNVLLIGLTAAAISVARADDDQAVKKDMAGLQGVWSMVSGSADGQAMPDQMLKQSKRVCQGDETTTTVAGRLFMKAKITIDPSKKPKTIDYEMTEGFTKGKKQLGIYELEGDTFKACFGAPGAERPADFTSKPGDRRTLSVWKREKAATASSTVGKERPGAFKFPGEQFLKITGSVKVLDAHTIVLQTVKGSAGAGVHNDFSVGGKCAPSVGASPASLEATGVKRPRN